MRGLPKDSSIRGAVVVDRVVRHVIERRVAADAETSSRFADGVVKAAEHRGNRMRAYCAGEVNPSIDGNDNRRAWPAHSAGRAELREQVVRVLGIDERSHPVRIGGGLCSRCESETYYQFSVIQHVRA